MAWERMKPGTDADRTIAEREWKRRARLLVDENLGEPVAVALREQGWNAKAVGEFGLDGRDDQEVLGVAWRERRFLLTQDQDFLDNRRFPFHRNPGLIVLPKGSIDTEWTDALWTVLNTVGRYSAIFEKAKIVVNREHEITVYNQGEGRSRYRFDRRGGASEWIEE